MNKRADNYDCLIVMIHPRGGPSVCTKWNWLLSKGYPAFSSATILQGEMCFGLIAVMWDKRRALSHWQQQKWNPVSAGAGRTTDFQELVRTPGRPFMCERAIKPRCVGRCSCAARMQVADLWGVVNQRFGACRVSWIRSSVQSFRGT